MLVATTIAFAVASCNRGDQLYPVTGTVRVDGKPAARAIVMFQPESPSDIHTVAATGTTSDDGSFTLASGAKPGAKPGKYIVTVVWPDPKAVLTDGQKMMGVSPYDAPDVLRGRYATRDKSTLRAEVKSEPNALEPFDLKPFDPK